MNLYVVSAIFALPNCSSTFLYSVFSENTTNAKPVQNAKNLMFLLLF